MIGKEVKMRYGVSYYPEHKEPHELEHDIALIKESGFNFVRMGEFAWCKFEPVEGRYEFDWLDEVIERLGKSGVYTVVCTPTACPPAWLVEKHPEVLYKDNRGFVRPFGGRRTYCYNNPVYREYSRKIAEEIGKHYGNNPYVLGFQIDNELAQESTGRCHCDVCKENFWNWLEKKYETIDNLNKKMGTIFWGQTYNHFRQINMPINTIEVGTYEPIYAYFDNPSLRLDYERFCSESITEYQDIQTEALRKYTDKIITTNATGLATNSINYYESFKNLDVYAFDYYPSLRDLEINSFPYAFARGILNKDFWLLEFASGGGHGLRGAGRLQAYPGAMKQSVIHAFASGAELVAHFQFRTFPYGAEQLNYAIVDADGIPRRRYFEVKDAAHDLKLLENILENSKVKNQVAICVYYDVLWALKIKPINQESFDYLKFCTEIYNELIALGIGADVISYNHNLEEYKAVIIPTPFVMSDEFKARVKEYVKKGGILLSTFLTGVKNIHNTGINESLPCGLTDLFGIVVAEVEPVFERTVSAIELKTKTGKITGKNKYWTEVLESNGAEFIGIYEDSFRKGLGVISKNTYGKGKAYYLGTGIDSGLLSGLLKDVIEEGKVERVPFTVPEGVEIITREYQGRKVYCIFNFLKTDVFIQAEGNYTNIITNKTVDKDIKIEPKGYVFLMA